MDVSYLQMLSSPFTFLTEWHKTPQEGLFRITSSNNVVWHMAIMGDRVRYATHSLQTIKTLEFYLQKLGYGKAIAPSYAILHNLTLAPDTADKTPSYDWSALCVQQLYVQGILSPYQANHLIDKLSRESIETALWCTSGTIQQLTNTINNDSPLLSWDGMDFNALMQTLQQRQQTWNNIADYIQSPYQRPYCLDVERIHESGTSGALPVSTLQILIKLMTGRSIRQLAHILKQDELKFSQLLYPYVKKGIVTIKAPLSPLDQLPLASSSNEPKSPNQSDPVQTPTVLTTPRKPNTTHQPLLSLAPPSQTPPLPKDHNRYKIVCIDDNTGMLEVLEQYLEDDCFDVTTVSNPMQSISALFAAHPDLVLMDVSMPGINGHRLCQILKRSSAFKNTPIIMVSGNTGTLDKTKAKAMGATDYLSKPFSKETLLDLVAHHLRLSRSY